MHSGTINLHKGHSGKNHPDHSISRRRLSFEFPHAVFEKQRQRTYSFPGIPSGYAVNPQGRLVKLFYCKKQDGHGLMPMPEGMRLLTEQEKYQIRNVFIHSYKKPVWTMQHGYVKEEARLDKVVFEYEQAFKLLLTGDYGGAEKWDAIGKLNEVQFCFGACLRSLASLLSGITSKGMEKPTFSFRDTNTLLEISAPGFEVYMFAGLDTIGGRYGFYVHTTIKNGHETKLKPLWLSEENMRHVSEILANSMLCYVHHRH